MKKKAKKNNAGVDLTKWFWPRIFAQDVEAGKRHSKA
jgi:hypothetical protein